MSACIVHGDNPVDGAVSRCMITNFLLCQCINLGASIAALSLSSTRIIVATPNESPTLLPRHTPSRTTLLPIERQQRLKKYICTCTIRRTIYLHFCKMFDNITIRGSVVRTKEKGTQCTKIFRVFKITLLRQIVDNISKQLPSTTLGIVLVDEIRCCPFMTFHK